LWPRELLNPAPREGEKGSLFVAYNFPYHYAAMNYDAAEKFSNVILCTNVPVDCPLCPTFVFGQPQTIWKYSIDDTIPG
jgi:hypothetical protein